MKLIYLTLTLNLIIIQGCSLEANNSPPISPQPHQISTAVLANQIHRLSPQELPPPFSSESASRSPQILPIPENATLKVPMGFKVSIFAENLDAPRWLCLTPTGEVLVTETRQNRIRLLKDTNQDGIADEYTTFAQSENGLDIPFGMAFTEKNFFVGNHSAVLKFPYQKGQESLTSKGENIVNLPRGGYRQHWTRNLLVSPDGKQLYISIGSRTNVDTEPLPRASVQVMNLDNYQIKTFAHGLRNPVGLDWHPISKELYTTVNERDGLGDDLVPDYLTRIRQGEFYGWPFAYLKPQLLDPRQVVNNKSSNPVLAAQTKTPDVLFQAHSAALGLQFYDGKSFSNKYKNGAFVAFRGSWNRQEGTGYKVVFVPFGKNHRPLGYYEDFLTGFLTDPAIPSTWGRPVGLLVLPDGSLLITEEMNGRIYRVQFSH